MSEDRGPVVNGTQTPTERVVSCERIRFAGLMGEQRLIILRHLDEHKWIHSFSSEDLAGAMNHFNKQFGWLLRQMYCQGVCEIGKDRRCDAYSDFLRRHNFDLQKEVYSVSLGNIIQGLENTGSLPYCENLTNFLSILGPIVKQHIGMHMWFNHIPPENLDEAVRKFNEEFGWGAREVFCDTLCSKNTECSNYKDYLAKFRPA